MPRYENEERVQQTEIALTDPAEYMLLKLALKRPVAGQYGYIKKPEALGGQFKILDHKTNEAVIEYQSLDQLLDDGWILD